jgi:phenol hydroxylase P3 protein
MAKKKLTLTQKYHIYTRGLDWEPTYVSKKDIYPYAEYEGIKIKDWNKWEDPFRMTVDAYWKFQAEKDRRFYAILDGFIQNQGHLTLSDARYLNSIKLFIQGVTPLEYMAHRGFAFVARHLPGAGPRTAGFFQSMDELRHTQIEVHAGSNFNRYYDGFHSMTHMHDRVWYLSVPKSYFDDAVTAGPFEYITAISFSFEYALTNLLFVPFMSGAAYNGDTPTMTFGFSAQSDESRHMTLGLQVVKFLLEQHEDNVPIIQAWIDKWWWRGYRLTTLVAAMMDYMLPKRVMSWKESFELYIEDQILEGLFRDLEKYGIRPPLHMEQSIKEKEFLSHDVYWILFGFTYAAAFHTWIPTEAEMEWLAEKYPRTFNQYYRPLFEKAKEVKTPLPGGRFYYLGLPQLCQVCQIPMGFCDPDDPKNVVQRHVEYKGEVYHFCSDGCKWIFEREPEKYIQSWLPVHEIYKGNCFAEPPKGPDDVVPQVLRWYNIQTDNFDYFVSEDYKNWKEWHKDMATVVV